ncbi:hypothetical protein [Salinigranum salinum]|uniref:hypothetical protein n=1 Tax=Salinigranum salinum TaxID=1364937 RepID=UPI0012611D29|nr:hypothetical protein [Salinigranum salinum]
MRDPTLLPHQSHLSLSRRSCLLVVGAVVTGFGSNPAAATGSERPFEATVSCDVHQPARVTVTNVSDETYQLRDIDSEGVDAVDGRPVLGPGDSYTNHGVSNGTAVLRAFDPESGTPVGGTLRVEIDCRVPTKQPLEATSSGGTVRIRNVSDGPVEVRDLDREGGDLLSGRPVVGPDEVLEITGVDGGTYYVQAWDTDDDSPLAPPVELVVDGVERAFFDVTSVGTGSSTTAGDPFDVSASLTNTGSGAGTRTVELRFDDETVATMEVTLDPDESADIEFVLPGERTIDFEPNRSYTVTVDTGDDAASTEKYVLPP